MHLANRWFRWACTLGCVLTMALPQIVWAEVVTLLNGMQLNGSIANISEVGETPIAGGKLPAGRATRIVLVDDELRRTYVSENQVRTDGLQRGVAAAHERIPVEKRVARSGRRISAVGPIINIDPFDEFGNRIFSMNSGLGRLDIVQGITEITPLYTKVEGILVGGNSYVWDMRVKTSAIPRDVLSKVMMHAIDKTNPDDRLRIVKLYIEAERYEEAEQELQAAMREFPELANLKKELTRLRQLAANRAIREIERRKAAGQHQLVYRMLNAFPAKGVAGETLLKVSDLLDEYKEAGKDGQRVLRQLDEQIQLLKDPEIKNRVAPIYKEISTELNLQTLPRMADFARLVDDGKLTEGQKVALAISGWLLGNGEGSENLAVALSLYDVRNLVRQYLQSERQAEREVALAALKEKEGSEPRYLAKLLAQMKPPIPVPDGAATQIPGMYQLRVPGLPGEEEVEYLIQVPPEYDPYKPYPCVVTLNGSGTSPAMQLDWWAGTYSEELKMRRGQATRHGYIVIAPRWRATHQTKYKYTAKEHAAVLHSLWDASRRFSIDTDKVFLSGHSIGGDAAWDIGLAHPDQWAGVLPIVATADRYVELYWENARRLPLYFVGGELDGNKTGQNAAQWNRYLSKHTFDAMVVLYQGRGHEAFHDEIQRMFEWMQLYRRDFFPKEFDVRSLRPWDNYFWWAEMEDFPERATVPPAAWPPKGGFQAAVIEGNIYEGNKIRLNTAASQATVWLSPEFVDFQKRITITVNRRRKTVAIEPSSQVLLEDVRRRGDRKHPFWAKYDPS